MCHVAAPHSCTRWYHTQMTPRPPRMLITPTQPPVTVLGDGGRRTAFNGPVLFKGLSRCSILERQYCCIARYRLTLCTLRERTPGLRCSPAPPHSHWLPVMPAGPSCVQIELVPHALRGTATVMTRARSRRGSRQRLPRLVMRSHFLLAGHRAGIRAVLALLIPLLHLRRRNQRPTTRTPTPRGGARPRVSWRDLATRATPCGSGSPPRALDPPAPLRTHPLGWAERGVTALEVKARRGVALVVVDALVVCVVKAVEGRVVHD